MNAETGKCGPALLVLAPGTLGRLGEYVSGTTLFLEYLCEACGCTATALTPERLWRNRGGMVFPRRSFSGGLEILRKGLDDSRIHEEDYEYFLQRLEGRQYDVLLDMNGTNPEFRDILVEKFDVPVILTVEQAGVRAGLSLEPSPSEETVSEEWKKTLDRIDAVVSWHLNDMNRLDVIGDGSVPAHHVFYAVGLMRSRDEYISLPRNMKRACCVGSLYANRSHWKRSYELEQAVRLVLDNTPIEEFLICGFPADREAEDMLERLKARHGNKVRHVFHPGDRDASIREIAQSSFLYNPIGGNQIGSTPVEAWATETPLILTGSDFGNHLEDSILCKDIEQLPHWINLLHSDSTLRSRIVANGSKRYDQSFTAKGMALNYLRVINECIEKRNAK